METKYIASYTEFEETHPWYVARRSLVVGLLKRFGPIQIETLMESGCGTGRTLKDIEFARTKIGIDSSVLMLANKHVNARTLFVKSDLIRIPMRDRSADVVLMMDVLEHVSDDSVVLDEILRVCKPGGIAVITLPAMPSLWSSHDEINGHYRRYTKNAFAKLLDRTEIEILLLSFWNFFLFIPSAAMKVCKNIIRAKSHDFGYIGKFAATIVGIVLRIENALLQRKINLPVGTSLVAVVKKK